MDILPVLFLAIIIDLALGEPPRFLHPVVWMGKVVSLLERGCQRGGQKTQFCYGLGIVLITAGLFVAPVYFLLFYLKSLSFIAYVIAGALVLKSTFSLRELRNATLNIKRLMLEGRIDQARFELRSLVSRDTRNLSHPLLISAAVESVAENTSDSFIAPVFYFLLLGVPGAVAYRVVNTLDSMIGYHGKYEYLGKFASRLDDVLNFIPARLTALLLVLAAFLMRKDGKASWWTAREEHSRTESPNAGWTMAAMAGALRIRLEKPGQYSLGESGSPPVPETIADSLELAQMATLVWTLICFTIGGMQLVFTAQA